MATRRPIVYASFAALAGAAAALGYGVFRTAKLTATMLADRKASAAVPPEQWRHIPVTDPARFPRGVVPSGPNAAPIKSADPSPKPGLFGAMKEVYYEFSNDDVMTQAAALAFYSGLAFAPLLTLAVWAMRIFFGDASKQKVADSFKQVIGDKAAQPLGDLLNIGSNSPSGGMTLAGIVSIVLVAFSASGVFGQVQSALNSIWHVQSKPGNGMLGFVQKRTLSLGMLLSILFLLMTSLIVSTGLQTFLGKFGGGETTAVLIALNNVVSIGLFTVLFAMLFKYVPDAKIGWKPVWVGGLLSAVLFTLGKYGLGIYLGKGSYQNSYGAVIGSFVALLVWVYYSSIILLIGGEATEVYARRKGQQLQPDKHAVRVVQTTEPA